MKHSPILLALLTAASVFTSCSGGGGGSSTTSESKGYAPTTLAGKTMRFVHLNPKNQPVSNEWYFFSSGKELLVTISNPSWSGDADYRGSYTYQRTGDNTGTITTADMPRQGNGYHSKMKYVVHLEFSGSSAATGTFREMYEESDRPQMNEDYSWQNQPVTFD